MDNDNLLSMELNNVCESDGSTYIRRVVGGWLYEYYDIEKGTLKFSTFVPEPAKIIKAIDYSKPFTVEEVNKDPRLKELQYYYDSTYGIRTKEN